LLLYYDRKTITVATKPLNNAVTKQIQSFKCKCVIQANQSRSIFESLGYASYVKPNIGLYECKQPITPLMHY